ncbi:RNA polymerase sigma factor [Thermoleophilia bacterium SCSIO 60948]|nr:RNA polymerase sigma factor [Thermoleophilia bacterium SCSIO 60948]
MKGRSWLWSAQRYEAFYAANADDLVLFFARRVLDPQVALDLAAETLAQAFVSRQSFRGDDDVAARSWLYGIARHTLARYLRKGATERRAIERVGIDVPALSEEEHRRVEEQAGIEPLRAAVRAALQTTKPAQRDALRLRVVEERPYPEVAALLGVSEQTARARVSRGLRSLAAALELQGLSKEELA